MTGVQTCALPIFLTHYLNNDVPLAERDAVAVLAYVKSLWGFDVELRGVGADDVRKYRYELDGSDQKAAAAG